MISIIIPTYNHAEELDYCLDSIRNQTYQNFEIIVVDDGSVDNPEDVVRQYSNLEFIRQPNLGAAVARNRGFELARGEEVIFVDADAVLQPECLAKMHQVLKKDPAVSFIYSAFKVGTKKMRYVPFNPHALRQYNYIHTTSLIRSKDFPGWDESLKKFQDWDLWLTMVSQGKKGQGIDEVLFRIINPGKGTMSQWLPKIFYKLPWPIFGWQPKAVASYFTGREIIRRKHKLD